MVLEWHVVDELFKVGVVYECEEPRDCAARTRRCTLEFRAFVVGERPREEAGVDELLGVEGLDGVGSGGERVGDVEPANQFNSIVDLPVRGVVVRPVEAEPTGAGAFCHVTLIL